VSAALVNELVSLGIVYHAGGLAYKLAKGRWRELICNADEMKEMEARRWCSICNEIPGVMPVLGCTRRTK
jgi:hypothetical protein